MEWNATREDLKIIHKICDRIGNVDTQGLMMDLDATHSNGCPLDFEQLLTFDDFNFYHDISGIAKHLDRNTGKLKNCFRPRCAK